MGTPATVGCMLGLYFVAILSLIWPAIFNGQPLLFFDSQAYFNNGAKALKATLGLDTRWLHPAGAATGSIDASPPATDDNANQFISAGRSVYYGLLVVVVDTLAGLWASILVQAAIVLWTIKLTVDCVAPAKPLAAPLIVIALAVGTTLPFFASYVMPDFLTGLAVLATAVLFGYGNRLSRSRKIQLSLILLVSVCSHTSHLLIVVALTIMGALVSWVFVRRVHWRAMGLIVGIVATAAIMQMAFSHVVGRLYGHSPTNPPFVTARLIEDGPGYRYLKQTCPSNGFKVCTYLPQLPEFSDDFLWSRVPGRAAFGTADDATKNELSQEQFRLAWSVVRFDTLGQVQASSSNFARQLSRFNLMEFVYPPDLQKQLIAKLPESLSVEVPSLTLSKQEMPLSLFSKITGLTFAASALFIAVFLIRNYRSSKQKGEPISQLWIFVTLSISGVILNAAVTGVFSTVHDRYQARVIWVIPAIALLIIAFNRSRMRSTEKEKTTHA